MAAKNIFCIFVLAVVLPAGGLSALQGGEGAVCHDIARRSVFPNLDYYDSYHCHRLHDPWRDYWARHELPYRSVMKSEKCCEGYVNIDGTCKPQCKSSCENGFCSKPDKCECNEGYEQTSPNACLPKCRPSCINGKCVSPGRCECDAGFRPIKEDTSACEPKCSKPCDYAASCTETIFCVVTQPANVSFEKAEDQLAEPIRVEIVDKNYQYEWKGPMCHNKCLEQLLNTIVVNLTLTNGITTHYFIPVDSPCNVAEASLESPMIWTDNEKLVRVCYQSLAI